MSRPAKRPVKAAIKKSAATSRRTTKPAPKPAPKPAKSEAKDWKTLNDRGSNHTLAGRLDKAIADFDAAVTMAPNEALPLYNRGATRFLDGDLEGAVEDFTAALERDPQFVQAYQRRGIARVNLGEMQEALTDFDAALRVSPDNPEMLMERGTCRAELGDFDGAIQDFQRALTVAPEDWEMRGHTEDLLESVEEAKEEQPAHDHGSAHAGEPAHDAPKEMPTSVIERVITEAGWKFSREDDGQGVVDYLLQMDESSLIEAFLMRLSEPYHRLVLYILFRPKAKKEHRSELCEFVARANHGMGDGNFEMDFDDGSVRFRISLNFTGVSLAAPLVRNLLVDALNTIELYQRALGRVIAGKAKAKAAVQAAEQAATERGELQ
jgi:Flp pilus assembly protein TadD